MELQFFAATDKLHIRATPAQQSRQVQRGSSAADHDNVAPSERLNLAMASAVGKEFRRQMCQVLGNIFEVSNPDREHHPAGLESLSIRESQEESAGDPLDAGHELVFQLRHHAVAECEPVGAEGIEAHRNASVGILDSPLRAELPQRERLLRVVNVRREAIRLEHHAFRHMLHPAIHWTTENAEWDAAAP